MNSKVENYQIQGDKLKSKVKIYSAINCYLKALEIDTEYFWSWLALGICYYQLGKFSDAVTTLERAVEINANNHNSRFYLGQAYLLQGEFEKSILNFQKFLDTKPELAEAYYGLGESFLGLNKIEQAINNYEKSIYCNPQFVKVYEKLSKVLNQIGLYEKAQKIHSQGVFREVFKSDEKTAAYTQYNEVYYSDFLYYPEATTIDESLNDEFFPFSFQPKSYVISIPNGIVYVPNQMKTMLFLTQDKSAIDDLCWELEPHNNSRDKLIQSTKSLQPKKINGTVACLIFPSSHKNYFHWIFDTIARYHLIDQSNINNIDYWLFNSVSKNFHQEAVSLLNIDQKKIITIEDHQLIEADSLIVPSCRRRGGHEICRWSCQYLRQIFLGGKTKYNDRNKRKIYISRKDARVRNVANEDELASQLKQRGFEIIELVGLSIREQVELFNSSQTVIAPHGAGLTNLVFCEPGTKVIEIFAPSYIRRYFYTVSALLNLEYFYFIANDSKNLGTSDVRAGNIEVDLSSFLNLLEFTKLN